MAGTSFPDMLNGRLRIGVEEENVRLRTMPSRKAILIAAAALVVVVVVVAAVAAGGPGASRPVAQTGQSSASSPSPSSAGGGTLSSAGSGGPSSPAGGTPTADKAALAYVTAHHPGSGTARVLAAEISDEDGQAAGEVRVLAPDGHVYEVYVSPASGTVLHASADHEAWEGEEGAAAEEGAQGIGVASPGSSASAHSYQDS